MSYPTVPTQMDIIDYMLQSGNEIPLLDRAMTDTQVRPEQLHYEGIDPLTDTYCDEDGQLTKQVETASRFQMHH